MAMGLIFIGLLIGVATLYLRQFVSKKAQNLAQKQDLADLTTIVERVKSQFERANAVEQLKLEKEFSTCVNTWSEACDAHREFCRLFPIAIVGPQPENQAEVFGRAQLKFCSTLESSRPFMHDAVWEAFEKFDVEMCLWKNQELPMPSRHEVRTVVRRALDECNQQIKNRFVGVVVLREPSTLS
ncbi:MAG: hypothetical protein QOI04_1558 [Verrucomicrobiota bacterium]|jgi:phenylalanyl-tRNA synthetase alpha subunit